MTEFVLKLQYRVLPSFYFIGRCRIYAVSYTHLDVYKRQMEGIALGEEHDSDCEICQSNKEWEQSNKLSWHTWYTN